MKPPAPLVVAIIHGAIRDTWCERCLTAARLEWDIYGFRPGQAHLGVPLGTFAGCQTCDPHMFAEPPD